MIKPLVEDSATDIMVVYKAKIDPKNTHSYFTV